MTRRSVSLHGTWTRTTEREIARKAKIAPAAGKRLLGIRKYRHSQVKEQDRGGLCTGLAYTEVGGEIPHSEVAVPTGKGKRLVTGCDPSERLGPLGLIQETLSQPGD